MLDVLVAFEIEEGDTHGLWRQHTTDLVRRYGVTFYDAAYHALALVEKGLFVPADARYARRVVEIGGVQMLHDYR